MTAIIFPGQASHAEGMETEHRGRPLFERGLELLDHDPFARLGDGTRFQQPAIFLCSVAAWEDAGIAPGDVVAAAGHSLGEYAALVAAGALDFEDALALVDERAAAMADAAAMNPGAMVAMLGGEQPAVLELGRRLGLTVANDNAPGQLVLAGAADAVEQALEVAREETGARARRLDVTGAFHSPLMAPAAERLSAALARTPVAEPRFPVISNSSVAPFSDIRRELGENMLRPVRWRETLLAMHALGAESYRELGPGEVLGALVKRTLGEPIGARP